MANLALTSSGIDTDLRPAAPGARAVPSRLAVAIEPPEAIGAAEWDALHARAVASPYQGRRWVTACLDTIARAAGQTPCLATLRDGGGRLVGLFPLTLRRRLGVTVASFVGDKHANHHMALLDPALEWDAATLRETLRRIARAAASGPGRIDAFHFINQPETFDGQPNPLALIADAPAVHPAYGLDLGGGAEAALARAMSRGARKQLRNKRRRLADLGEVSLLCAATAEETARLLEAFAAQKAGRFRDLGLDDPFADPSVMEFLRLASRPSREEPAQEGPPAVQCYGLMVGDRVAAAFLGAVDARRFSGMATSFVADEAVARTSPGEQLLVDLILDQERQGRTQFDLGVGEARYKASVCDRTEPMVETTLALTWRGSLVVLAAAALRAAKRLALRWPGLAGRVRPLLRMGRRGS